MLLGIPRSARCVQRFDDSLNSAIHITYRISLRSSSMREPRDPLLKVVLGFKGNDDACQHNILCHTFVKKDIDQKTGKGKLAFLRHQQPFQPSLNLGKVVPKSTKGAQVVKEDGGRRAHAPHFGTSISPTKFIQ
jgi:hypothetical protein